MTFLIPVDDVADFMLGFPSTKFVAVGFAAADVALLAAADDDIDGLVDGIGFPSRVCSLMT